MTKEQIKKASLEELNRRANSLVGLMGTEDEAEVEAEFQLIHAEFDRRFQKESEGGPVAWQ